MRVTAITSGQTRLLRIRVVAGLSRHVRRAARPYAERRARLRWEHHARAFYRRFVAPGDLCFDVGANVGNRTAAFLDLGARVVAVEPQACAAELRRRHSRGGRLTVIEAALGADQGEAELLVGPYDTVSTLSHEWVDRVRAAGRFRFEWEGRVTVPVTTLDALIAEHGVPAFCKIDVEGYEAEVLRGLSRPIPALSFEFTPEHGEAALACVERLRDLGFTRFAYSAGESLVLGTWRGADEIAAVLRAAPRDGRSFGDVYAAT